MGLARHLGWGSPWASNLVLEDTASENNHSVISDRNAWAARGEETLLLMGCLEVSAVGSSRDEAALQGPRGGNGIPRMGKGPQGPREEGRGKQRHRPGGFGAQEGSGRALWGLFRALE